MPLTEEALVGAELSTPATARSEQTTDQGPAVTVAYVHSAEVAASWHHSLIELLAYDLAGAARVMRGGWVAIRAGTDGLVESRNLAVTTFLADRASDWLWWLDTDMGFEPDALERLMQAADPGERPIVGALCFSQRELDADGMGGYRCRATPTVFDWAKIGAGDAEQMGFAVRWDYPRDTLVRCAGTGMACVLIHRSVFARLEARYGPIWYNRVPNTSTGQLVSEDLSFCLRAGALGIPVHVHTGVRASHYKHLWLAEEDYIRQRAADAATQDGPPPPATAETAVLVPVLGRPEHAEPFMASLRASTGLATCYAVCDADDADALAAWDRAGATVLLDPAIRERPGTFAEKVNFGYSKTGEQWLFLVGSDVRFWPGWLDHAQAAAGDRYHVVGTNDLGNPRVTSGEHATHLLVRRSYVDEVGASWDGPGIIAHEGYRHWYVDDEVVTAAKQRGVWAMALAAKVEHLHPYFGKGEMDAVYKLGTSFVEADKALFEERVRQHAR